MAVVVVNLSSVDGSVGFSRVKEYIFFYISSQPYSLISHSTCTPPSQLYTSCILLFFFPFFFFPFFFPLMRNAFDSGWRFTFFLDFFWISVWSTIFPFWDEISAPPYRLFAVVVTCWMVQICWSKLTPPWTHHSWPNRQFTITLKPHANVFFLVCGLRPTSFVFMPRSVSVSYFISSKRPY